MKKLMTVLAACIVAGLVNAQSVTSANMVGYQAISTAGENYNMLAVNWQKVSGGAFSIQSLFDASALVGGGDLGSADNIIAWDPAAGYKFYYLYGGGTGVYAVNNGKWFDLTGNPTTDSVTNGAAFWLLRRGSGTLAVTVAGQVDADASVTLPIKAGAYNMIGNPYPTALAINGTNLVLDTGAGKAIGGGDLGSADNIIAWDPSVGYKFYYLYGGGTGVYAVNNGKWFDLSGNPTSDSLAMGNGAWYLNRGSTDWNLTITKTY